MEEAEHIENERMKDRAIMKNIADLQSILRNSSEASSISLALTT